MLGFKRFRTAAGTIAGIEIASPDSQGRFNLGSLRLKDIRPLSGMRYGGGVNEPCRRPVLDLDFICTRTLHMSNGSWRVDETYVKVKGRWMYLYRAVDSHGQTIDFLLSAKRDADAAKRFFRKALAQPTR